MANQNQTISQLPLADTVDGRELLPFAKDSANGAVLVSALMAAFREGMVNQSALAQKQNLLTAGHGIEITPAGEIRSTLDTSPFKVVTELPYSDIENKIYLVPDPNGDPGKNEYVEYLWVGTRWEIVGKFTAAVDLTPYLKSADAATTYAKKTEIPDVSGFALQTSVETLSQTVSTLSQTVSTLSQTVSTVSQSLATLTETVSTMKTKVDTIPTMPPEDGKCYAYMNGAWVAVADSTESLLTATN